MVFIKASSILGELLSHLSCNLKSPLNIDFKMIRYSHNILLLDHEVFTGMPFPKAVSFRASTLSNRRTQQVLEQAAASTWKAHAIKSMGVAHCFHPEKIQG